MAAGAVVINGILIEVVIFAFVVDTIVASGVSIAVDVMDLGVDGIDDATAVEVRPVDSVLAIGLIAVDRFDDSNMMLVGFVDAGMIIVDVIDAVAVAVVIIAVADAVGMSIDVMNAVADVNIPMVVAEFAVVDGSV